MVAFRSAKRRTLAEQETTMRTRTSCGVLLLRGKPPREFLLMRHLDRWDLPKGHVNQGETEEECALREFEEETGLPRDAIELDTNFRYETSYPVKYKRTGDEVWLKKLVIFFAHLRDETADDPIAVTEHLGHQWFPWNPPHNIQKRTIDPLLKQAERYLAKDTS